MPAGFNLIAMVTVVTGFAALFWDIDLPMVTMRQATKQIIPQDHKPDFFDTEYLKSHLKGRSIRAGGITLFFQGSQFLLHACSTLVLARLLDPSDFGLIAMVTAITGFAMMFGNLGLSTAAVQKAEINHHQVSTLFWINVGLGVLIAAVVISLAPAVAWFYGDPRLTPVTMVLGVAFIFHGLTVQHMAMLERHMRFFAIGIVGITSVGVGVGAAIVAGILGAGYWALVLMHVVLAAAGAIGKWIAFPWKPGLPKRGVGVRELLGFGGNVTGFNIVNYLSRNADNILIGKLLGPAALGFYSKAYGLLMMPITQIRGPLMGVGMPALSRLQAEPQRYKNYYLKMVQMLAFITIPMAILLGAYSHQIIMLVLGPKWEQAVGIFRILAFAAIIQPVAGTAGLVMLSSGHAGRYFKMGVFTSVAFVTSFLIGLPWGTSGVALSYTIANYILVVPTLLYAFNGTPVHVIDFGRAISLPFIAASIMVMTSRIIFYLCSDFVSWLALLIALFAGGLFYIAGYLALPGGLRLLKDIKTNVKLFFHAHFGSNVI